MSQGPGKYDDLCTELREKSEALACIVIVLGGSKGNGFSVQAPAAVVRDLPDILENVARQMRESVT